MILTFAEDFSSTVNLDAELIGTPDSSLYFNRGVHPAVNVNNLLAFLPSVDFTFATYAAGDTYSKFSESKNKSDIVVKDSKIYQSLANSNTGNDPAAVESAFWLETNIESLRLKSFIWNVEDNMLSALSLDRKLIENQFIYDVGEDIVDLSDDYAAWVFEPKGSDYVKIRINQMSLQALTTDPVSLYVINQGILKETLTLNPNDGLLEFEDVGYIISGKGKFIFAFDSQEVLSNSAFSDPLRYDGFVAYPLSGTGATPEDAVYSETQTGNGLNFNITAYTDTSLYVSNNLVDFARLYRSQFELDTVRTIVSNANAESSGTQRIIMDQAEKNRLYFESTSYEGDTVVRRYNRELKITTQSLNRTLDRFTEKKSKFRVKRKTI